jgi:hypothetical protein
MDRIWHAFEPFREDALKQRLNRDAQGNRECQIEQSIEYLYFVFALRFLSINISSVLKTRQPPIPFPSLQQANHGLSITG